MTKLPTTLVEADAQMFARDVVTRMRSDPISFFGIETVDPRNKETGRKVAREMLKWLGYQHVDNRAAIADYARAGWSLADEALREMWREMSSRGETCHYLNAYIADVTRGPIKRAPARRKGDLLIRDIAVAVLVQLIVERFNVRPTRSPESRRWPSACSIAAKALGMSESAVNGIWIRLSKSL